MNIKRQNFALFKEINFTSQTEATVYKLKRTVLPGKFYLKKGL